MTLKNNIVFSCLILVAIFYGCSTQKNTRSTRAYHELTTRYNIYFNAEQSYDESLSSLFDNHKDNWHILLPLYPNSSNKNDTIEKPFGGPFNRVVDKTTKAIQEHSISAKPKRERDKLTSQEYRDWLKQNEFNPFIDKAWLLMGKAHVQNGDYLEAISVFANTIRLFSYDLDVISEAQIWLIRAYAEIGWYQEAEIIIEGLQARSLPDYLYADFVNSHTLLMLKQNKYDEVIPILNEVIAMESNKTQRRRVIFLLGQIHSLLGENNQAYNAFERVKGINTPYEMSFNALIAQSRVTNNSQNIVDALKRHGKRESNINIQGQIYGAIGDYYLRHSDTISAVENYLKGELLSIYNSIDKALIQERLGDIFYKQKLYVQSSEKYNSSVSQFPQHHIKYKEVVHRADVLSELTSHIVALNEQDSLQHLARLPQSEQLKVVNTHIEYLKRVEKDKATHSLVEELQGASYNLTPTTEAINSNERGLFYFYNPQAVSQGVSEFKRKWGNRKLDDNWRTSSISSADFILDNASVNTNTSNTTLSKDATLYTPEFWLDKLPTTPEAILKSNSIIERSLFDIGNIAKNRLHDFDLAINSYLRLYNDFPNSDIVVDVAYNLYMIYNQLNDKDKASIYRNKIVSDYSDSDYAIMMTDPDYESVISNYYSFENKLYQDTYQAYQKGDVVSVHKNYDTAKRLLASSSLMAKFSLLDALAYATIGDIDNLQYGLEQLVYKYSNSDEANFAQSVIDGLKEGKELVADASAISAMDWVSGFISSSSNNVNSKYTVEFDENKAQPHYLLLFFDDKVQNRNELLFAVANHNFSTYQLRSFSTTFVKIGDKEAMSIKSFNSFDEAQLYTDRIVNDKEFKENITDSLSTLLVSEANYSSILSSKSLEQYREFMNSAIGLILGEKKASNIIDKDFGTLNPIEIEVDIDVVEEPIKEPYVPQEAKTLSTDERLQELVRRQEHALSQSQKPLTDKERNKQLRARERERKELIKQRDRERKNKIKEQEQIRKAKLDERARILREQNR